MLSAGALSDGTTPCRLAFHAGRALVMENLPHVTLRVACEIIALTPVVFKQTRVHDYAYWPCTNLRAVGFSPLPPTCCACDR
jgi:hypothetical protein